MTNFGAICLVFLIRHLNCDQTFANHYHRSEEAGDHARYKIYDFNNTCVDCSAYFSPTCHVTNMEPYINDDDKHKVKLLQPGEEPDERLAHCSNGYKITDTIFSFTCLPHKTRGCGVITYKGYLENKHFINFICPDCAITCGCPIFRSGASPALDYGQVLWFAFLMPIFKFLSFFLE